MQPVRVQLEIRRMLLRQNRARIGRRIEKTEAVMQPALQPSLRRSIDAAADAADFIHSIGKGPAWRKGCVFGEITDQMKAIGHVLSSAAQCPAVASRAANR